MLISTAPRNSANAAREQWRLLCDRGNVTTAEILLLDPRCDNHAPGSKRDCVRVSVDVLRTSQ